MKILTHATVFTGEALHQDCSVAIADGRIRALALDGEPVPVDGEEVDLEGRRLAPGFIDLQVNGGGGVLFNDSPTLTALRRIGDAHSAAGTTAFLPTLISDDNDLMRAAVATVRRAIDSNVPGVLGVHFEGPCLNPNRHGAHDLGKLRPIDDEALKIMTSLGRDAVTLVTLAPECASPTIIRRLCAAGVVVFAGHTEADYEQCRAAVNAGVRGFTHLFNAMPPMLSRAPGVVGAAIALDETVISAIADGHHVHPASLRAAVRAKGRDKTLLITDAMPTLGAACTEFVLGGERVVLKDGVLRNESGSLAGSHLGMGDAVRNIAEFAGLHWTDAVRMATANPARVVGVDGARGFVGAGYRADLVEFDEELRPHRIWLGGEPRTPVSAEASHPPEGRRVTPGECSNGAQEGVDANTYSEEDRL